MSKMFFSKEKDSIFAFPPMVIESINKYLDYKQIRKFERYG